MSQISEILNGWGNLAKHAIGILDDDTKSISENRLEICNSCEFRQNNICGECGCFLPAKVLSMDSKCPKDKW
jgi:hypothetical protein